MTDADIAKEFSLPVETVTGERKEWNGRKIIRAILAGRINEAIAERTKSLLSIAPSDLQNKQGEIAGLQYALAQITKIEK